MKARKPNTDQDAEVVFCVNSKPVTEYDLPPSAATARDDTVECFVPVEEGDRITIKGHFNGSVLNGSMDLLLDGSFLSDSRIEGTDLKLVTNRKIEFKKALNCPIAPDWPSIESPKELEEGPIYVKGLEQENYGDYTKFELASRECTKPGLGSVQVIIYVTQQPRDYYWDKYPDITIGHWRTRDSQLVRKSGILPEYELRLEVDEPQISQKRSGKHRRHWNATHFGFKPWAKFVFYYRSEAMIQAAGCAERSDHVQELEPADKDAFVYAEAKRKKKKQQTAAADEEEDDEPAIEATFTRPAEKMDRTTKQNQRETPRKGSKRRLGGELSLPRAGNDTSPAVPGQHAAKPKSAKKSTTSAHGDSFAQLLAGYGEAERDSTVTSDADRDRTTPSDRATTDAAVAGLRASQDAMGFAFSSPAPQVTHARASARDALTSSAATTSLRPPPSNQAETSPPTQNNIEDDTADMSHSDASLAAVLRQVPSASTIRDSIPSEGLDDFNMHIMYVDAGVLHHEAEAAAAWERRKAEVAFHDPESGRWFRKPTPTPKRAGTTSLRKSALHNTQNHNTTAQSPAPAPASADAGEDTHADTRNLWFDTANRDNTVQQDAGDVLIKEEEIEDTAPVTPTPVSAPFTPQPKSLSSAKRTASERLSPPGTQSPASKRAKTPKSARLKELQQQLATKAARKQELARELKAKKDAKAAKAEEKKRKAEERERREAEEIAALERANADDDEELADMMRQLQEDDEDEDDEDDEDEDMEEESEAE